MRIVCSLRLTKSKSTKKNQLKTEDSFLDCSVVDLNKNQKKTLNIYKLFCFGLVLFFTITLFHFVFWGFVLVIILLLSKKNNTYILAQLLFNFQFQVNQPIIT